ncbi:MAG TPA: BatA and WFA domain-containing protein [Vicinamibacterales bacterium]|nr:BatA and WFA domain-containing protein [Vicinamibacterales bacterium]
MSFLTPLYLAGAALVALPIILHLLRRDVAPPVPFTAVSLLRKSPVDRSRTHRLRDLLLLLARVAALLLLAGSFARPYVAGAPATGRTTVVAVDRSFSMAAPARFARAQTLAREAIDQAQGDRIALVAFDDRADVISAAGSAADARAALAALAPGAGATRYAAMFDKATELLMDEANGRLVVVSDLQRSGFDENTAVLPEGIDLQLRDAGAETSNLSVTGASIDRRRLVATVRNFGSRPRTTEVILTADDRPLPAKHITVAPGDAVDVPFEATADAGRLKAVIADADGYAADNERYALAEPRSLPRILMVGGGAAAENGFYLSRALLAEAEDGPDFDVRTVDGAAFSAMPPEQLRQQSVVMLLSTHGVDRAAGDRVRGFLTAGGGLFVAAGPDVDPAVVSALLGWQPALTVREMRNAGVLAATDLRHPVLRPFDAVAANFGQVMFERAWQVEASPAWRVVARYTNGGTALAERTGSAGRVLLLTSDVDRKWNDFPLNAAFVPFAQEVARYLGARPPAISTYLVADAPAGVPPRPGLSSAGNRTIAVNVDPRESSVARVTPAEFQALVTRGAGASQPRAVRLAQQTEGQQNYWRYGLMLMLAALVVEAFVGSR